MNERGDAFNKDEIVEDEVVLQFHLVRRENVRGVRIE